MSRARRHRKFVMSSDGAAFLVIDQEGVITSVPESRIHADKRAKELNALALRGSLGQRRHFEVVEVDRDTHDAAARRYVFVHKR